jgi:hypothetical protein
MAAGLADDGVISRALDYLHSAAVDGAGYAYQPGGPADSNSTALVAQAMIAAGAVDEGAGAIDALIAFQNDDGSYSWMLEPRDENIFSTVQAIPALADLVSPLSATPQASPVALLDAA